MKQKKQTVNERLGAAIVTVAGIALFTSGCSSTRTAANPAAEPVPDVVTADIGAGIRAHIREVSVAHGGFFPLVDHGETLSSAVPKTDKPST